jgi:Tfp pilus assembly protein PilO
MALAAEEKFDRPSISGPIVFLLLILLFVLGIWLVVSRFLPGFRDVQTRLASAEAELEQLIREEEQIAVLLSNAASLPPDKTAKTFALLPETQEIESLLANLEQLVLASGLELVGLSVGEGKRDNPNDPNSPSQTGALAGARELRVSMAVNGSYERLRALLELLEDNGRLIEPKMIEVKQASRESGQLLEFSLEFFAYYYPAP